MSNHQARKPTEKQIIVIDADVKEKDAVISFGTALYKIGEFVSCIKQTITSNRCAELNQLMVNKGMPKIHGDNLIYDSGVPCQVLGLDGNTWISGNVRVKVVFELITEKEIELPAENIEESSKPPLDDFRGN